ncbi:MAG: hypothetical protein HYY52_04800 [Candidatus Melainabacteria bacterium]|nr:hypothetical protein [Candidatus Melainabacteria bacterium]
MEVKGPKLKVKFPAGAHKIRFSGNPIDGDVQHSVAHNSSALGSQSKLAWIADNLQYGNQGIHALCGALLPALVGFWFNAYHSESLAGKILGRASKALGSGLLGFRDDGAYNFYGHGVEKLTDKEIADPKQAIAHQGVAYYDDYLENETQRIQYGEWLTSWFGKWATKTAKVKTLLYSVGELFGAGFGQATQIFGDMFAAAWWRIRMLGGAFHANFATTMFYDIPKLFIGSFFSGEEGVKKWEAKKKELGELSKEYFEKQNPNDDSHSGLGLYFKMLKDRVYQHLRGCWKPEEVLREKREKGIIAEDEKEEIAEQKRTSFVELTAPITALVGLPLVIFLGPIKAITGIFGIQSGFMDSIYSLRKTLSLVNYQGRFIQVEKEEGSVYKELENLVKPQNPDEESKANDLTKEYYYATKARYQNAQLGKLVVLGSFLEPVFQWMRSKNLDSKFFNFFTDTYTMFHNVFFLMFFNSRRKNWARMELVKELLKEEGLLEGGEISNQIQKSKYTKEQVQTKLAHARKPMNEEDENPILSFGAKVAGRVTSYVEPIVEAVSLSPPSVVEEGIRLRKVG